MNISLYRRNKNVIILVAPKEDTLFTGEIEYYMKLLYAIQKKGGTGYILPISKSNQSFGFQWNEEANYWMKVKCPKPSFVYNRYPYRRKEKEEFFQSYLSWLNKEGIPYFNHCFFNKVSIWKLVLQHQQLKIHFPQTDLLRTKKDLHSFLEACPTTFLKESSGSQGHGIWKIERHANKYTLYSQEKTFSSLSYAKLANLLKPIIQKENTLMQKGLTFPKIDDNPYDYRVLMLYCENEWHVVGIGIRHAAHGGFTTHVPQGGQMLSMDDITVRPQLKQVLHVGNLIGTMLQEEYIHIKEFSFDFALDYSHHFWILDINSKPMSFDEQKIQKRRIILLTKIFMEEG
ncbi:YheC/YheD family protein [Evansella sp. AB-P1]|uniref:YheC/YheD family protein n=1 Tax=Evansella sp. AB-P1 TaxID=3037653 RepID=UPI002420478E|nr:YheC/YheD family protein [Evansella sp. AB-P1]MDG5786383.1 YheC/YheD family protein [Evansella sp. AB-P1]